MTPATKRSSRRILTRRSARVAVEAGEMIRLARENHAEGRAFLLRTGGGPYGPGSFQCIDCGKTFYRPGDIPMDCRGVFDRVVASVKKPRGGRTPRTFRIDLENVVLLETARLRRFMTGGGRVSISDLVNEAVRLVFPKGWKGMR